MRKFQPFEVVNRGSKTQPQLVENLNKLTMNRIRVDKSNPTITVNIHVRYTRRALAPHNALCRCSIIQSS